MKPSAILKQGGNVTKHYPFLWPIRHGANFLFDILRHKFKLKIKNQRSKVIYLTFFITLTNKLVTFAAFLLKISITACQVTGSSSSFQQS